MSKSSSLLLLVASTLLSVAKGQFCEPLFPQDWTGLKNAIAFAYPFVMLCPFRIEGDACPKPEEVDGYVVDKGDLYVMCESFFTPIGGKDCVINCPGRHFTVMNGASLTLDGIALEGSRNSAVSVMEGGSLSAYVSSFTNNSISGNGGAIRAAKDTRLSIRFTNFTRNTAESGGAIYNLGKAVIQNSNFTDNKALESTGGALFSGRASETVVSSTFFLGNSAALDGPAIFDGNFVEGRQTENIGCNNFIHDVTENNICNGVYEFKQRICMPFSYICEENQPQPPTVSPAPSVSSSPSSAPSVSSSPSSAPSVSPAPSVSSSPSSAPSNPAHQGNLRRLARRGVRSSDPKR